VENTELDTVKVAVFTGEAVGVADGTNPTVTEPFEAVRGTVIEAEVNDPAALVVPARPRSFPPNVTS